MRQSEAIKILHEWDQQGRFLFTTQDLLKLFHPTRPRLLGQVIRRITNAGLLKTICHGVYLFSFSQHSLSRVLEAVAIMLRRGEYNYLSLESMLSEYDLISQIPVSRLTIMTTGRSGVFDTPYGTIEFTHTNRNRINILENTLIDETRPLRLATRETALRDLRRVGRNLHLLNPEVLTYAKNRKL